MLNRIRNERSKFDDGVDSVKFPHFPVNVEEDTEDITDIKISKEVEKMFEKMRHFPVNVKEDTEVITDIKISEEVEEMFEEMRRYSDIQTPVA